MAIDAPNFEDEAEFAGYVDSGLWELEEWLERELARRHILQLHFRLLWRDFFED